MHFHIRMENANASYFEAQTPPHTSRWRWEDRQVIRLRWFWKTAISQ